MRLRQRLILRLEFRKESHVLDGDDGLVSEGLEQLDLLLAEGLDLGAPYKHRPDERPRPEERDTDDGAEASQSLIFGKSILGVGQDIENVNRLALEGDPPDDGTASRPKLPLLQQRSELRRGT